jgi:hypothetical protein
MHANTGKHAYDLLIPVGLLLADGAYDSSTNLTLLPNPSPLYRTEFPEGSSCHHSNPIRYIVGEASHPVISATVACSPRGPVGIHRVYSIYRNYLLYLQSCDFVSHHNIGITRVLSAAKNVGVHALVI